MSERAAALANRLRRVGADFIRTVEGVDERHWARVPAAGVWSAGKDAEHVIEGALYHQAIVRATITGGPVVRGGGVTQREVMTARLDKAEILERLRERTEESARLTEGLSDAQLALAAPPLGRDGPPRTLEEMIEGQMIRHYLEHQENIRAKVASPAP
jgi:DinB superfamily